MHGVITAPAGLGAAVRHVRTSHALTQVELAARLGVSQRWLSELETGRPKVFGPQLFDVLEKLGIALRWETVE